MWYMDTKPLEQLALKMGHHFHVAHSYKMQYPPNLNTLRAMS